MILMTALRCSIGLSPVILFLLTFIGSGTYFYINSQPNAFSQISPVVAIIPAIIFGIITGIGSINSKINDFINGICNKDIITMCLVFILAGAFVQITQSIGSVEAIVNAMLAVLPPNILLTGIFIISAFIATAIGTSMGVVAVICPIAVELATQDHLNLNIMVATVVSGAMFGDNLSLISDTTIAAVNSVNADLKSKFRLNAKIAFLSAFIMCIILLWDTSQVTDIKYNDFEVIKILPYITIIFMALFNMHVFSILIIGTIVTIIIGFITIPDYNMVLVSTNLYQGISNSNEIMILSLLIGGMSGIIQKQGSFDFISYKIECYISKTKKLQKQRAEITLGIIAALYDICIANNTIAIILSGDIARKITKRYRIAKHRAACWLDIFSCGLQGILPYSAQILLASSIANISPLEIVPHVYYCYILLFVTIFFIFSNKK